MSIYGISDSLKFRFFPYPDMSCRKKSHGIELFFAVNFFCRSIFLFSGNFQTLI